MNAKSKTALGQYLHDKKSNKSKIASDLGFTTDRLNALTMEEEAILYADEFFPILFLANYYAGITVDKFDETVTEIFPNRSKNSIISKYSHMSPSARLFLIHVQQKKELEKTIGMKKSKLTKFANGEQERATALELINFCDGMNFPLLKTYEEYFGKIPLPQ